ncbi:MAG: valine--tRNA ligase [Spirochaetaceae bacterium]|nr:valine--tRNA ligase [Spirochaetaceae bacterium]
MENSGCTGRPLAAVELARAFDPKSFEDRVYALWKEKNAFAPSEKSRGKKSFVIVIPPPNVTGVLHLGHALNNCLQDIVIRYHRMRGDDTLWVPGTDHAGIATQNVMEKRLKAQGKTRHDLGREKFIEAVWEIKKEHHAVISQQLARMGSSVDWQRERFTLDKGLSLAVREVFVTLYERGLLYRGNYLVNWCPSCGTALSDDEVEHEDTPGKMYHIRYPVPDTGGFVEIATTRPETMLGDTALAVHPEDERYRHLAGKTVELPLAGRRIPVIADTYVDREFGTGVVKITPAHDPNDWEVAKRHGLKAINILTPDGKLNAAVPEKYRGLAVAEAREAVLRDLEAGGFFIKEEPITHAVGHCYRCHTVIEPFLSEQWFVRMKPLADKALAAWKREELVFYPRKWENTYQHWLQNIRDWCVSRQLWWGHRIPVWYCLDCGKATVSRKDPSACSHCGSKHIEQDPDVLDTWFSSWLWPFSTLGWEEKDGMTEDLARFYPTSALVTAYDIIFFWVARMVMAGLEFTGQVPFRDIYLHGLLRDKQGRKMSKSLGNGLDPLELVDEYGADALKFTLAFLCAQGQDLLVDKESFRLGSKFANKIWNASRYILMNLEGRTLTENPALLPLDKWMYSRLNEAAKNMEAAFLSYRYNDAAQTGYEYFWNDFCDWYVEATKLSMRAGDAGEKDRTTTVLLDVLSRSLALLHPLLPFITEEIYGKLPTSTGLLITASYPSYTQGGTDNEALAEFGFFQELVRAVRTLRSECTISPDRKLRVLVRAKEEQRAALLANGELVKLLAGIDLLETETLTEGEAKPQGSIGLVGEGFEAFVYIAGAADLAFLKNKFTKEIEKDRKFISSLEQKLSNEAFIKNAPPELVEGERKKLAEARMRTGKIEAYIRDMA